MLAYRIQNTKVSAAGSLKRHKKNSILVGAESKINELNDLDVRSFLENPPDAGSTKRLDGGSSATHYFGLTVFNNDSQRNRTQTGAHSD